MKIMIGLETMGLGPAAPIVAIGAVAFGEQDIIGEFYTPVSLASSMEAGLSPDANTILWWLQQDIVARVDLYAADKHLYQALLEFSHWLESFTVDEVWANGCKDFQWIESACKAVNFKSTLWSFHLERDFRTAKSMLPKVTISDEPVAHHALCDARWQARYLIAAMKEAT